MAIQNVSTQKKSEGNKSLTKAYDRLERLIEALNKKEISEKDSEPINEIIQSINTFEGSEKEIRKFLKQKRTEILKYTMEKLHFMPKHHYLALGMTFGMCTGVVFGQILNNLVPNGSGISIGMVFGIAIGAALDKRALDQGKQLDYEATL